MRNGYPASPGASHIGHERGETPAITNWQGTGKGALPPCRLLSGGRFKERLTLRGITFQLNVFSPS